MANFTQNLTDSIRFFAPAVRWNTPMKWGTDKWGYDIGSTGNFNIATASITSHQDPIVLLDQFGVPFSVNFSESISFTQGSSQAEYLRDHSSRYLYVLKGGVTNDENARTPSYAVIPRPSSSWSLKTTSFSTWVSI